MEDNKPKLLICYHSAEYGGVEKQILDIVRGLSSDFSITVVCPKGSLVRDYIITGANHVDLKPRFEADLIYSFKIFKLVKQRKFDIVHSHELMTGSLAVFGAWLAGCPKRVYHVHTPFSQWKHTGIKKLPAMIANTSVNFLAGNIFATDVIALTPAIRDIRIKREFICGQKIRVIPNGIDLEKFLFSQKERERIRKKWELDNKVFVIGNVGRFTEEKGHYVLIRAFRDFLKKVKNPAKYRLVLAGGGKLLEDVEKKAGKMGMKDKIIFTGFFDEDDKNGILSSFDLFVMPSFAEGFGISLIEAMANSRPCLVSDILVFKDVGGNSIKYFKAGSSEDLSSLLLSFCLDNLGLEKYSYLAKSKSQEYSIERFWQNYRSLYLSVFSTKL